MIRFAPDSPRLVAAAFPPELAAFQERLSGSSLAATASAACDGEAMLIIEHLGGRDADEGAPATWIVTAAGHGQLVLEAVVDEIRLELLVIGPAERVLARLEALASQAVVNA